MPTFSITFRPRGPQTCWFVGIIFSLVGISLGLILPWIITPRATPQSIRVAGIVERYQWEEGENPAGSYFSIFSYELPEKGRQTIRSIFSTNRPSYVVGESVTVMVDPNDPATAFVEGDRDLRFVLWVLRFMAVIFFGIGTTVIIMLIRGVDSVTINRIGGLLGALSFSLPSSLALPALWLVYEQRPNFLFRHEDSFGTDLLLIGSVFSIVGVIVTALTLVLNNYQARTGKLGWSWSWSSDDKTK